ncbi:hypothetical protein ACFPYI_17955 [Halomarina salina]|uniref:DUF7960 domain-containing protein n=1 Tax=Halomarina salina TaxID=1872699 RepID=A0ABD5RRT3_9EURY|nr:hypothetical protein [Halomarina salina]
MYTGKTEKPCCLCGDRETVARLDLPPRAVQSMENSGPIAWRDIVGEVSVHFCESDWDLVTDLVLDTGMSPLPRCNVAQASLDIREDFEALLNDVREEPDQRALEERMLTDARETIERVESEGIEEVNTRDAVEAYVRLWALEDADRAEATE